jgi:hypothetical protein
MERRAASVRFGCVIGKLPPDQGRARGLYDEQLQRVQQEKLLIRGADAGDDPPRPAFFTRPDSLRQR